MNQDVVTISHLIYEGKIPEAEHLIEKLLPYQQFDEQELGLLAQYALSIGKLSASLSFIERIIERGQDSVGAHLKKAMLLITARRYQDAKLLCQSILQTNPENLDARNMLANCLLTSGDFEEAEQNFLAMLDACPNHSYAIASLAKCRKFSSDGHVLIQRFRKAFSLPLDEDGKARVNYAIAKLYNDLGEYENAWKYAKNANTLIRMKSPFKQHAGHREQINRLISSYTKEKSNLSQSDSASEHVLIVGMPRTGTTLMEQIFSSYQDIFPGGEVPSIPYAMAYAGQHFQAHDLGLLNSSQLNECADAYERYYSELGYLPGQRIVNKVPYNYLYIAFFKAMFPKGKVIYMKRSRMDVVASVYFEHFSDPMSYSTELSDIWFVMLESERLMTFWLEHLPTDICTVQYESLTQDYPGETKRILDFLDLDPSMLGDFTRSANAVETPSVWQVRQGVYTTSTERWKRYPELVRFSEAVAARTGQAVIG